MAKNGATKTKRNGNGIQRRAPSKRPTRARSAPPASVRPNGLPLAKPKPATSSGVTHLRYHFATALRMADNLVAKAVSVYDRLFALDPREASEIHLQMGKELAREDKLDEALESLRKVLASKPDHGEALLELGLIHVRRGAPHAAAEMLEKAKNAGQRSHRLHLQLARVLGSQDKHEEALQELRAAIALEPKHADSHFQCGVMLDRLGRYAEAVKAFEAAIQLAPEEVRYQQSLGFTFETLGRRTEAIKCFKRALEMERAPDLSRDLVDA